MKALIVIVLLLLVLVTVLVALAAWRFGRRSYQRYSGLEQQRAGAKRSRDAGVDRLKDAERELVRAQRDLIAHGRHHDAQAIERVRVRLTTAADRHRFATWGYAPLADANSIREAELAELQARDSETIGDAQLVSDLVRQLSRSAADGTALDLSALDVAVAHLTATLDRRKAVS